MLLRERKNIVLSPNSWRLASFFIFVCFAEAARISRLSTDVEKVSAKVGELPKENAENDDERDMLLQQQQQEEVEDDLHAADAAVLDLEEQQFNPRTANDGDEATGSDFEVHEDPNLRVAPKYMLELYRKFSYDKYSHPIANIVRSFLNINPGGEPVLTSGNNSRIVVQTLMFNISSINRDEEIHLAELRLYAAKKTQRILVYEVVQPLPNGDSDGQQESGPSRKRYQLLTSREILSGNGDWETFPVTDVLRRWVRTQASAGHILEVRVDTRKSSENDEDEGDVNSEMEEVDVQNKSHENIGNGPYDPILVVFSNDRKRHKIEMRELHEIQSHENEVGNEEDSTGNGSEKFSPSPSSASFHSSEEEEEEEEEDEEEYDEDYDSRSRLSDNQVTSWSNSTSRGSETTYPKLLQSHANGGRQMGTEKTLSRKKRNLTKHRRRKAKRNICRRKPMYINFRDVQWEKWILEPSGYQAYECTGKCYFPLSERLTPTKYAVVKSLLHATYPKRTSAVCCVPTRLEPISLLYVDEHGIITYKYKYDGMVVAECGCR